MEIVIEPKEFIRNSYSKSDNFKRLSVLAQIPIEFFYKNYV